MQFSLKRAGSGGPLFYNCRKRPPKQRFSRPCLSTMLGQTLSLASQRSPRYKRVHSVLLHFLLQLNVSECCTSRGQLARQTHLFIYLFIYLSIYVSIYLSIYLSMYLSIYLSIYLCPCLVHTIVQTGLFYIPVCLGLYGLFICSRPAETRSALAVGLNYVGLFPNIKKWPCNPQILKLEQYNA